MKATIPAAALAAALRASPAARNPILPVLGFARVTTNGSGVLLETTDMEVFVTEHLEAEVTQPGTLCFKADKLRAAAQGSSGAGVELHPLGARVGRSRLSIETMPDTDYPAPDEASFNPVAGVDPAALGKALHAVVYACGRSIGGKPFASFVQVKSGLVAGVDGCRAAVVAIDYTGPELQVPMEHVPRLVDMLCTGSTVAVGRVGQTGRAAHLRVETGSITLIARLGDVGFPDVQPVIPLPSKAKATLTLQRAAAVAAIKGFALFAVTRGAVGCVELAWKTGATHELRGEGDSVLDLTPFVAASEGEGSDGFDVRFLLDTLSGARGDTVTLHWQGHGCAALITTDDRPASAEAHVLMPLRM